jgi:hypothetical protein
MPCRIASTIMESSESSVSQSTSASLSPRTIRRIAAQLLLDLTQLRRVLGGQDRGKDGPALVTQILPHPRGAAPGLARGTPMKPRVRLQAGTGALVRRHRGLPFHDTGKKVVSRPDFRHDRVEEPLELESLFRGPPCFRGQLVLAREDPGQVVQLDRDVARIVMQAKFFQGFARPFLRGIWIARGETHACQLAPAPCRLGEIALLRQNSRRFPVVVLGFVPSPRISKNISQVMPCDCLQGAIAQLPENGEGGAVAALRFVQPPFDILQTA